MPPRRAKKHNNVAKGTTKTKDKRTRRLAEVMDVSHTDSTTHQSESWDCPVSARKHLIPDKVMISSRRASLRSFKRFIETGITSSTRSQSQKKLKKDSSTTYEAPKMSPEESEKVENAVAQVDIPGVMEDEVSEAEKEEPLAETISKAISTVGGSSPPSPSFSLKLTQIVNMADDDEDDEYDSAEPVNGYQVKPEYIHILKKILSKHGDIAENCTTLTMKARSSVLETICGIISELQQIDINKMKEGFLLSKIAQVNGFENMNFEIEWLHQKLDEMLEARKLFEQCATLKEYRDNNIIAIENAQKKLDECEEQKKKVSEKFRSLCDEELVCKEALGKAMDESSRIEDTINYALPKLKRFVNCLPLDDLI